MQNYIKSNKKKQLFIGQSFCHIVESPVNVVISLSCGFCVCLRVLRNDVCLWQRRVCLWHCCVSVGVTVRVNVRCIDLETFPSVLFIFYFLETFTLCVCVCGNVVSGKVLSLCGNVVIGNVLSVCRNVIPVSCCC